MPENTKRLRKEVGRLIAYDPESGVLTWRVSHGRARAGSVAGNVRKDGYRVLSVSGRYWYAHRLAWFITYGTLPAELDHANGNQRDNRLKNIRVCTRSQNSANHPPRAGKRSKYKGVSWHRASGKWVAMITVHPNRIFLGGFKDEQSAYAAYCTAAREHFGEFARIA